MSVAPRTLAGMCGRFVVANVGSELVGVLRVDVEGDDLPGPSFNVAPTDRAAIVLDSIKTEPPTRRLESARWGLVPSWAKDPSTGARAINARAEEVEDKPMFRQALIKRRAVIPASGYYEWKTHEGVKTPHYIHPADGSPLLFAGLYEWWKDPAKADDDPARWLLSFTILTRDAVGSLGSIHDRMPLFVDSDYADAWLDPTTDNVGDVLDAAIDAAPALADTLDAYVVGTAVGNVRNNSPELIEPAE
ncbi:SOS response-associated peptidase [Microbacterium invictum]